MIIFIYYNNFIKILKIIRSIPLSDDVTIEESVLQGPTAFMLKSVSTKNTLVTFKTQTKILKNKWIASIENSATSWD